MSHRSSNKAVVITATFVSYEPFPEVQQGAVFTPEAVQLCLATSVLAFPTPVVIIAVSQLAQRCFVTRTEGLFAPRTVLSTLRVAEALHVGQAIAGETTAGVGTVALRSSICARARGEAVTPSSPVTLYCAFAEPMKAIPAAKAMVNRRLRVTDLVLR